METRSRVRGILAVAVVVAAAFVGWRIARDLGPDDRLPFPEPKTELDPETVVFLSELQFLNGILEPARAELRGLEEELLDESRRSFGPPRSGDRPPATWSVAAFAHWLDARTFWHGESIPSLFWQKRSVQEALGEPLNAAHANIGKSIRALLRARLVDVPAHLVASPGRTWLRVKLESVPDRSGRGPAQRFVRAVHLGATEREGPVLVESGVVPPDGIYPGERLAAPYLRPLDDDQILGLYANALASEALARGQEGRASKLSSEAVRRAPEFPQVWRVHANALWASGDRVACFGAIERAIELRPRDVDARAQLAWLHQQDGNVERAWTLLEGSFASGSTLPETELLAAELLVSLGREEEAFQRIEAALHLHTALMGLPAWRRELHVERWGEHGVFEIECFVRRGRLLVSMLERVPGDRAAQREHEAILAVGDLTAAVTAARDGEDSQARDERSKALERIEEHELGGHPEVARYLRIAELVIEGA